MTLRPFLAGLLALILSACGGDRAAEDATRSGGAPPIWQIAGEDDRIEGWLFGTVHALPDNVRWGSPMLDSVLSDADTLVVEVANLDDGVALGELFAQMAVDPASPPLEGRVDPELRPHYQELLTKAKVRRDHFDALESWAAALSLANVAQDAKTENGVDRLLIARFTGREIVELEGAKAQLGIFDRLPEVEQRDLLNAVIAESRDSEMESGSLAETWRSGDLDKLAALSTRGILSDPELYDALLAQRNRNWTAQIENLLSARERPFIAVGAGHVVGPDGLPAMLEARGFKVKRIQ